MKRPTAGTLLAAALATAWFLMPTVAAAAGEAPWQESEAVLPSFPQDGDLQPYYVSAAATNRYLIDMRSISVGDDGVVRYTLVVLTAGGATNVSHEGIRCSAREVKLYAMGHADRSWKTVRSSAWQAIENKPVNRHHAALSRDYFCPLGSPIRSSDEGRDALRRGKHPDAP